MRATLLAALVALPLGACMTVIDATDDEGHGGHAAHAMRAPVGDFGEAALVNNSGQRIGRATLTQGPTGLLIRVEAEGLRPGWHGIHIHAVGRCEGPFTSAGAHINHAEPKAPHGLLNEAGPDDGDLPNVWADAQGRVNAEVFTSRARISREGPGQWLWDADGSALVIHANPDDHRTQPIGGAGDRVACGVMAAG